MYSQYNSTPKWNCTVDNPGFLPTVEVDANDYRSQKQHNLWSTITK